jgi:molybdopterin molybdotransferase
MSRLLDWQEARDRVVNGVGPLPAERLPVARALGRALAEDIAAPEPMPGFDNSAMDGFAVRAADTAGASASDPLRLTVIGTLPAGSADSFTVGAGEAVRIMTGAPMPDGADAVVPVENTDFWDEATRRARPPRDRTEATRVEIRRAARAGDHLRRAGESVRAGEVFLTTGHRLRGAEIALLHAVGIAEVDVHRSPRVGVLSTGDEVVPTGTVPRRGQIRDSNRPGLLATLTEQGFEAVDLGLVRDDEAELARRIVDGAKTVDFLLTSGGVSVGDFDFTRTVLDRVGEVEAYAVAVKPGKPQLFGQVNGTPVFGLPGNPVSSLVVFDQFVLPALKKMAGRRDLFRPWLRAVLADAVRRQPGRVEFMRVRLESREGELVAHLTGPQGSGVLSSLTRADGYVLLPADREFLEAGSSVLCQLMTRD